MSLTDGDCIRAGASNAPVQARVDAIMLNPDRLPDDWQAIHDSLELLGYSRYRMV
ncbi:hypothetical protein [Burkholderia stagnalis]|uniref:hypothetical protein n=1 Tax=Burkholderia stagnalis TaxID=1503054 RepID=UPI000AE55334|nr:hypothetical protein [Burkholderia stagnalis]